MIFRRLIENIVDNLDRINEVCLECIQRVVGLPSVNTDPEKPDLAIVLQFFKCFFPLISIRPTVFPNIELLEIDTICVQVPKTFFSELDNMIVRKTIFQGIMRFAWPLKILGWNFSRAVESFIRM